MDKLKLNKRGMAMIAASVVLGTPILWGILKRLSNAVFTKGLQLKGKHVLITGGSTGLGLSLA